MNLYDVPSAALTDKSYLHGYLRFYNRLLADLSPAKVLEVGVDQGHSLRMWSEFWPDAEVHGVEFGSTPVDGDVVVHRGDAYTDDMVDSLPGPFDFILDDGPHDADSQAWFCANYPKLLAPGGILCVEDIRPPVNFRMLALSLPEHLRACSYGVDLCHVAPDQSWDNHYIFVVDTGRTP